MQEKSKILYKIILFNSKIDSKIGAIRFCGDWMPIRYWRLMLFYIYERLDKFPKTTLAKLPI